MASESSAVLELNDADGEDTDAPSVTDDTQGVPLIMEHGYDIAVKVDAPIKQLSTLETYVTYRVRCVCARWSTPPYVRRRYNHFKALHRRLAGAQPWVAAPPLPPLHSARQQLDRYSPAFVALRTLALHAFLDHVAKHPILTHNDDFRIFVTAADDELDKVFKNENSALNLWGLSTALYGNAEVKQTNGARVRDPEFTSAVEYLNSLQQKLTCLCGLTHSLHKGTHALCQEYLGMKRALEPWSGRAARAVCAGAAAAARPSPPRPAPQTLLPLLAAYASAHADKIRQRDALHAAYVAGTNTTDDLHNRLEQASEALRSELSDWLPKTRGQIKAILLDIAQKQVSHLTHSVAGWEHALMMTSDANVEELFKTVSKNAVHNLSPSKSRTVLTPTETERDLDELEVDSNSEEDRKSTLDSKVDSVSMEQSLKSDVVSDPLREFSDVDLS